MLIRVLMFWFLAFPGNSVSQIVEAPTNSELACSGGVRDVAEFELFDDVASISTIIRAQPVTDSNGATTGYGQPAYTHSVHLNDGKLLLRYEARGLFNNAGPLSCEERLAAAQRQLMDSLDGSQRLDPSDTGILSLPVRMTQLAACLRNADACNTEPHYVQPSDALQDFGADGFDDVLDADPWSFSVFVSDCQRDMYLYEPDSGTALKVESSGC